MASILIVAPEANPFAKTGGLADVVGALGPALQRRGNHVAVVMPRYRQVDLDRLTLLCPHLSVLLNDTRSYSTAVYTTTEQGVTYYFIECAELYDRDGLYSIAGKDFEDNYLRFAVFSLATLELTRYLRTPEILHCHDWQSALVPVYLRTRFLHDQDFTGVKTLLTVHNLGYQGLFGRHILREIGLDESMFDPERLEFYGKVNLLKGGLLYADQLTTVSPTYAREIQSPELGFGLDGLLRKRSDVLCGILNGVDYAQWDPQDDPHIAANYNPGDLGGKAACKRDLLREFGLPESLVSEPLIGIVSRFDSQKGFDLIEEVADDFASVDCALVALGTGNPKYETFFREWTAANPGKVAVRVGFDNGLAHRIEAGADIFLMPSRYEPCGLNQMYSLRYGTVPVVHATGGLDDSVDNSTGFKFRDYTGQAMLSAVRRAVSLFCEHPAQWRTMMLRGMNQDFSWDQAAAEYDSIFGALLQSGKPA